MCIIIFYSIKNSTRGFLDIVYKAVMNFNCIEKFLLIIQQRRKIIHCCRK